MKNCSYKSDFRSLLLYWYLVVFKKIWVCKKEIIYASWHSLEKSIKRTRKSEVTRKNHAGFYEISFSVKVSKNYFVIESMSLTWEDKHVVILTARWVHCTKSCTNCIFDVVILSDANEIVSWVFDNLLRIFRDISCFSCLISRWILVFSLR